MYKYSKENAAIYSELGVTGTTYEVSFNEMARLLGPLGGKTVLDFGSGAGRSSILLKTLGAEKVIGVDHNETMIGQAIQTLTQGIEFHLIDETIPLPDNSIDVAVSAHVFVEMKTIGEMKRVSKEIHRVLKPGGQFIVISTNPSSIGHNFLNWSYKPQDNLKSGDIIVCKIKKGDESFNIDDVYWTEEDFRDVLTSSGFEVKNVTYPVAEGEGWLDETKVAPNIVLSAFKKS